MDEKVILEYLAAGEKDSKNLESKKANTHKKPIQKEVSDVLKILMNMFCPPFCHLFLIVSFFVQYAKAKKNLISQLRALKSQYQRLSPQQLDELLEKAKQMQNKIDEVVGVWKVQERKVALVKFHRIEQIRAIPIDSDSDGFTQKLIEFYESCILWMHVK